MNIKIFEYGLICIMITAAACDTMDKPIIIKSEMAQLIVKNWQFLDSLYMNGKGVLFVSDGFNPFANNYVQRFGLVTIAT